MDRITSPLQGLDLNLLVSLLALLEECSVTRAAERMGQTQPTLSRALARLRVAFSDELLVREGRSMERTALAAAVLPVLGRLLRDIDSLPGRGGFDPALSRRSFHICSAGMIVGFLMEELLGSLGSEAPGVSLTVTSLESGAEARLLSGEVDLLLSLPRTAPELYIRHLAPSPFVVLLGPKHPSFAGELTLHDYLASRHVLLTPAGDAHARGQVDELLEASGASRDIALRSSHFSVVPRVLSVTDWACAVPEIAARWALEQRSLVAKPFPLAGLAPTKLAMMWHSRQHADPGHAWLRDRVWSAFQRASATEEPSSS